MFLHSEPLAHEPVEEVRAVPALYPQPTPGNTLFYGDNLDIFRVYICLHESMR